MADESADESPLQGNELKEDDELDELLESKSFPCIALDRFSLSVYKAVGDMTLVLSLLWACGEPI